MFAPSVCKDTFLCQYCKENSTKTTRFSLLLTQVSLCTHVSQTYLFVSLSLSAQDSKLGPETSRSLPQVSPKSLPSVSQMASQRCSKSSCKLGLVEHRSFPTPEGGTVGRFLSLLIFPSGDGCRDAVVVCPESCTASAKLPPPSPPHPHPSFPAPSTAQGKGRLIMGPLAGFLLFFFFFYFGVGVREGEGGGGVSARQTRRT